MSVITIVAVLFIIFISEAICRRPGQRPLRCASWVTPPDLTMSCELNNLIQLNSLSKGIYRENLTILVIQLNGIDILPYDALRFNNLISLTVKGKDLVSIDNDAFNIFGDSLLDLRLINTSLREVPAALSPLHKLLALEMEGNLISSLNSSLPSMDIYFLSLRHNAISTIWRDIFPVALAYLYLNNNHLLSLNGTLKGYLIILDISNNRISSLAGELDEIPMLKTLIAEGNVIESIDNNCFARVNKLQILRLSYNRIYEVFDGLNGLDRLKHLNVSHNGLTYLSITAFSDLIALEHLNLSHNNINNLEEGLFDCLLSLRYLDISFNYLNELNFLVSPQALSFLDIFLDIFLGLGIADCNFRDNSTLNSLRMADSGVICSDTVSQTICYLQSKGVLIVGNPCESAENYAMC